MRCMITRQRGGPLEPLNLEIEAMARRNRGRNRREQLRRRVEIEEMAEDNLVDPEIDRGVNGQENGQEVQNVQGGQLPPQHAQGANNSSDFDVRRGPSQSVAQVGGNDLMETLMMTLLDKVNNLSTQQTRENLPPLANIDPNLKTSQSLPQREEVNYMGMNNGQGGWYGQGKQVQQQGPPQPQGQGWFQNAPQQFPGGGTSYVPNARKHENFSYSNPKAAVQFPPGFDPGAKLPNHEGKPTNEDALNLLLKKMENIEEMAKSYKSMEAQVCDSNGCWYQVADVSLAPVELFLLSGKLDFNLLLLRNASIPVKEVHRTSLTFKFMPQGKAILDTNPIVVDKTSLFFYGSSSVWAKADRNHGTNGYTIAEGVCGSLCRRTGIRDATGHLRAIQVYLHPMVGDARGRYMSKSLGNVIDSLEVINGKKDFPNGLCFALVSYTAQSDKTNLDIQRVVGYRQWCNKIWNAIKFVMTKLGDDYTPPAEIDPAAMPFSCKWILSVLNKAISKIVLSLDSYEFSDVATALYSWWQFQFCDVFIEEVKPYFAGQDPTFASERKFAQDTLWLCLDYATHVVIASKLKQCHITVPKFLLMITIFVRQQY
ncbi:hypothetical protein ACS0TY_021460 [Phlomoides rotata]